MLKARTRLWTAILVLAALAFAQAGVALAGCSMERGMLAGAMSMPAGEGCGACEMPKQQSAMATSNLCVAHCTADLQQASEAMALVRSPVLTAVLFVAQSPVPSSSPKALTAPPPGAPPHRVLLHSFLI